MRPMTLFRTLTLIATLAAALTPAAALAAKPTYEREETGIMDVSGDLLERIRAAAVAEGERPTIANYEGHIALLLTGEKKASDIYYTVIGTQLVVVSYTTPKPNAHSFLHQYARYLLDKHQVLNAAAPLAAPPPPAIEATPDATTDKGAAHIAFVTAYSSSTFTAADATFYELKVEFSTESYMGATFYKGATVLGFRASTGTAGYEPCPVDSCATSPVLDPESSSDKIIGYRINLGVIPLYFPVR